MWKSTSERPRWRVAASIARSLVWRRGRARNLPPTRCCRRRVATEIQRWSSGGWHVIRTKSAPTWTAIHSTFTQLHTVQWFDVCVAQCSAVQYSVARYSTAQHCTVQCSSSQGSAVFCSVVLCSTALHKTAQYHHSYLIILNIVWLLLSSQHLASHAFPLIVRTGILCGIKNYHHTRRHHCIISSIRIENTRKWKNTKQDIAGSNKHLW